MGDTDTVPVILARMEVKLDQLVSSGSDHEKRLRALEGKGYVTARQMWAALLGVAACVGAAGSLLGSLH